jgi:peroxin-5
MLSLSPLQQYEEAVQHLLTSLSIQETDAQLECELYARPLPFHLRWPSPSPPPPPLLLAGDASNRSSGVTSQTLWDSLNISLLQFVSLSAMAASPSFVASLTPS